MGVAREGGSGHETNNKKSHTIELSVDVVVVVVDDVDSRCRIGEMAARVMTKLGTVALQVGASFSSES